MISVGVVTATDEVSNDTSNNLQTTTPFIEEESTQVQENMPVSIEKDTSAQKDKNLKASQTYSVTNFTQLNNYLTSGSYDTVTINIDANVILRDNITLNSSIKSLKINGNGKKIDGDLNYHFLTIYHLCTININNITIVDCFDDGVDSAVIINRNGTITISNSTFRGNDAKYSGGAIANYGNMTIIDTTFTNNKAAYGGAIENNARAKLDIINCTFNYNTATSGGAAIYGSGNLTIKNSIFTNNFGDTGGALHYSGNLTIINSTFADNEADGTYGWGGAIYFSGYYENKARIIQSNLRNNKGKMGGAIHSTNPLTIIESNLINNSATRQGGAIDTYIDAINISKTNLTNNNAPVGGAIWVREGNLTITDSLLENNNADFGGAIWKGSIGGYYNSTLIITDSTLNNNSATQQGGAIYTNATDELFYLTSANNSIKINNSNFTYNKANDGGAIYLDTNMTLENSQFKYNNATRYGGAIYANNTLIYIEIEVYNGTDYDYILEEQIIESNSTIKNTQFIYNKANDGGVIYNENFTSMIFVNSTLNNNIVESNGGAIYVKGNMTITNCTLNSNNANGTYGYGGAIYGGSNSNMTIQDSIFKNNYVTSTDRYVINFRNSSSINIINNIFENNTDNSCDMLFSDANENGSVDIHGNTYIDNYLESSFVDSEGNPISDYGNYTLDYRSTPLEIPVYLALRNIYNDSIRNGTIYIQYDANNKVTSSPVVNNSSLLSVEISDLNSPENNLIVNYTSDSKHYQSILAPLTITVDKIPTFTSVELLDTSMDNVTLKITVTNNTGDKVTIGNITVFDSNNLPLPKLDQISLTNGEVVVTIPSQFVGENIVVVVHYNDNDLYFGSNARNQSLLPGHPDENKTNITVGKIPTFTSVEFLDTTLGNVTLKVTVTNTTGDKVTIGNITVFNEYNLPISGLNKVVLNNGEVSIEIPSQTAGENISILVRYNENDIYLNSSSSNVIPVSVKHNSILTINPVSTVKVGDNLTITGRLVNDENNPISKENVTLTINTENIIVTTDDDGVFEYNYTTTNAGQHNLTVSFEGNKNTNGNTTNTTFNVDKLNVTINIDPIRGTALDNVTINVHVHDSEGNPVNGGRIAFKINNITLKDSEGKNIQVAVSNGLASLNVQALESWMGTDTTLEVIFTGTSLVNADRNTSKDINITARDGTLVVTAPNTYVNGTLDLTATVTDTNGSAVNIGYVIFKLNGKTLQDTTGKTITAEVVNGIAKASYQLPFNYGAYERDITAVFTHKAYNKIENTTKTKLMPIPIILGSNNVQIKDEYTHPVITAQIYNRFNGALLTGTQKVSIKFDGKSYIATMKNGIINETLPVDIYRGGQHTVEIAVGSSSHYDTLRTNITAPTTQKYTVTTTNITTTVSGNTTRLKAIIVDQKNSKLTKDVKVNIKINGVTFANVVASKGTLNANLNRKLRSTDVITIITSENSYYKSSITQK